MGKMVIKGNFEWDEEKNLANIQKHGFGFERILGMFDSPFSGSDMRRSIQRKRKQDFRELP